MTYVWLLLSKLAWRKPGNRGATVSIAFDDNKQNIYDYAFPLLKSRGMVGTFYVTTDLIGDASGAYLTLAEIKKLENAGCEIASHTKTHALLKGASDSVITDECSLSKQALQDYGFVVNNFTFPYRGSDAHADSIPGQYYRLGRARDR